MRSTCAVVLWFAAASVAAAQSEAPALPGPARGETAAAREQARLCERLNLEEAVAACRAALALGIGPARRGPVRQLLARHLVALEKWDELAEHFRDDVRLAPASGEAWYRLGVTLFFALDERAEAIAALETASKLAPRDAGVLVALGLALAADGRPTDAVASLEQALALDPAAVAARPAARSVMEAAAQGKAWP